MNPVGFSASKLAMPLTERVLGADHATASQDVNQAAPNTFGGMLTSGVSHVNSVQQDAQSQVHEMLTGGDVSQVEVITAVQKADMAFRMLVQVRNKLMAAYEELNAIRV